MQLSRSTVGFWFLEDILEAYWERYWWDFFCTKSFKWNKIKLLNQLHFISESVQVLLWFQLVIKWRINQLNIYKNYWHQQEVQQLRLLGIVPEKLTYGQVARLWNQASGDIQPLFLGPAVTHSLTAGGSHSLTVSWEQRKTYYFPSLLPFSENEWAPQAIFLRYESSDISDRVNSSKRSLLE